MDTSRYARTTIAVMRSRRKQLVRFIEAGLLSDDEVIKAQIEIRELEVKLGQENLQEVKRGRPRSKLVLRGEALKEYEAKQKEGEIGQPKDYSNAGRKWLEAHGRPIMSDEQLKVLQENAKKEGAVRAFETMTEQVLQQKLDDYRRSLLKDPSLYQEVNEQLREETTTAINPIEKLNVELETENLDHDDLVRKANEEIARRHDDSK